MSKPELSIIVPVYNVDKWIDECLHSIQNQTFKNWECILVNDGSTDFSKIICDSYAKKDERFRVINQSNSGVSSARNVGINSTTAPLLSFVDPDDYISENFYFELIECSYKTGAECVCGNYKIISHNKKEELIYNGIMHIFRGSTKSKVFTGQEQIINGFFELLTGGPWGYIFKRELWKDCRFPVDIDLGEDLAVIPFVISKANITAFVPDAIYYYRKRENSLMSRTVSKERVIRCFQASSMMVDAAQKEYGENALFPFLDLKVSSDIARFNDFIKNNPDAKGSRLFLLHQLIQEANEGRNSE